MLCRIAEALDVSVAELLGDLSREEPEDTSQIAKTLAQINEQFAIRNRRTSKVLKTVLFALMGWLLLVAILVILNIAVGTPVIEENVAVSEVSAEYFTALKDIRLL